MPDRVVFDAEALVALAPDRIGRVRVNNHLDDVAEGAITGHLNDVNSTEIHYTLVRKSDRATADDYLGWLDELGIERHGAADVWLSAAEFVIEHNPALGDAFALATAEALEATLLAGGDADYDGVTEVPIERFRDGPG